MNRTPLRWSLAGLTAALMLTLTITSCGGARFKHARCQTSYDTCMHPCADLCEGDQRPDDTVGGQTPAGLNNSASAWNQATCQRCVDNCEKAARRCEAELSAPEG